MYVWLTKKSNMETGMVHLHNVIRWIILILLVVSIVVAFTGWQRKRVFKPSDKKVWLFTMIVAHINFLVGLYLILLGRSGYLKVEIPEGTSIMKNTTLRFFLVEHPLMMLISIVLITLGHGMAKKAVPDNTKFRKAFWFFLVALILVLVAIPWPGREVARPLFPGM